jgi:hypothetical protein
MSQVPPIPPPEFTTFFDMSQHLGSCISPLNPPGFEVVPPVNGEVCANPMTSTPYRSQRECRAHESPKGLLPISGDQTIFHTKEVMPRLPSSLHERHNSDSFGQTIFYSMANSDSTESLEPDLFRLPATPPEGDTYRACKACKDGDLIHSLKTQLALQTELCGQFEAELRAQNELVEVLRKKLADVQQEETKKRMLLKQWSKELLEIQRVCQYLGDEVETSSQESGERSSVERASSKVPRIEMASFEGSVGTLGIGLLHQGDIKTTPIIEEHWREDLGTTRSAKLEEKIGTMEVDLTHLTNKQIELENHVQQQLWGATKSLEQGREEVHFPFSTMNEN